jgi:hypothetical protein
MAGLNTRNFDLTTGHQLAPLIVPYVLLLVATLCVGLRFRSRYLRKVKPGIDDWLCLVALVCIFSWQLLVQNRADSKNTGFIMAIPSEQHCRAGPRRGRCPTPSHHADRSYGSCHLGQGKCVSALACS